MHKRHLVPLTLVATLIAFAPGVQAATILVDPALLRITSLNDEYPSDTTTSPVQIGGDGFRLTYISSDGGDVADKSLVDPVLLILGIPSGGVAPALTVQDTSAGVTTVSVAPGGTNMFGGSWNVATGFAGTFDGSLPGNEKVEEDIVGFDLGATGSQNYSNWTTGDPGPTTSWDIYVYSLIFDPDFAKENWVDFLGPLVGGTYVIAYGCDELKTATACKKVGDVYSTPFTYAGVVVDTTTSATATTATATATTATATTAAAATTDTTTVQGQVPEPTLLMLFGAGLVLAGRKLRRKVQ